MRDDLLTKMVSPEARERLSNIMLVKPEKVGRPLANRRFCAGGLAPSLPHPSDPHIFSCRIPSSLHIMSLSYPVPYHALPSLLLLLTVGQPVSCATTCTFS